jgi:transcriptional regulator with XRE-family HTH domain
MKVKIHDQRAQIASRLRAAREAAGLSQGQVAKLMGFHRPTISEIEAGRRRVSAEELTKLVEIYGVSVEWITSKKTDEKNHIDEKISLAARELSKMKDTDLERLMKLIRMLRKSERKK